MAGIGKLRQFQRTAAAAGYTPDDTRGLITDPRRFASDHISNTLAASLRPESISALLATLEGDTEAPSQPLLEIGNVLYDFEQWLEKKKQMNIMIII
jgi:hypothetical protein